MRLLSRIAVPAFVVAGALTLPACGDQDTPPTTPPSTKPAAVEPAPALPPTPPAPPAATVPTTAFVDGMAAGAEKAASPDDVMFVYVGRHSPT